MSFLERILLGEAADTTRFAKLDSVHQNIVTIEVGHSEVHSGSAFHAGHFDLSMASAATFTIAFKTPATPLIHMEYGFATLSGAHLDIYKDSTWDASSGTLVPIYNRKHESSPTSSTILENQSTGSFIANDSLILDPTTLVHTTQVVPTDYAFGSVSKVAGESRAVNEIVLQPSTQYTFLLTSDSAANKCLLHLDWYEHTSE